MEINCHNISNHIIIEGLWGLGKTQIAKEFCNQFNYAFVQEPLHTQEMGSSEITDLDSWYLDAHLKSQKKLSQKTAPIVMERSILSTYAFSYALGRKLPDLFHLGSLQKLIEQNKILLVYLKMDGDDKFWRQLSVANYSKDIQQIITKQNIRMRYQEWYEEILPKKYGIVPFTLYVSQNESRRKTSELINEIYLCLRNQRVAQVNVICFTYIAKECNKVKILIMKRREEKGGFWQSITGGIHPGEAPLHAATREVSEEIGVQLTSDNIFWTPFSYSFMGAEKYRLSEYVFGCKIDNPGLVRVGEEHETLQWLDLEQAQQLLSFNENKKALDIVYKKAISQRLL